MGFLHGFPPKMVSEISLRHHVTKASCKVRGRAAQQGDAQGLM